jgi:hypothetical protein
MKNELTKLLLVSIPHAGLLCPREIPISILSDYQKELSENVDWYTEHLYDFRDLLGNKQVYFPYSQVYVNVNRHPEDLDQSVPIFLGNLPVYKQGNELSTDERKKLVLKYHNGFHRTINNCKKLFILDGHSTLTGHKDAAGEEVADGIILSDWQKTPSDPPEGLLTAPEGYLDTYAEELDRRLSGWNISISKNRMYSSTYGHIMATHGWDGKGNKNQRVPLILQETNEDLYIENGIPDVYRIEQLRRIFAESVSVMLTRINRLSTIG